MVIQIKDIKPCPFCGSSDMLDVGRISSNTVGVECRSCYATMERRLANDFPVGVPEIEDTSDLRTWMLNNAIEMWNKRAKL